MNNHVFLGVLLAPLLQCWLFTMDFCVLPSPCRCDCWDSFVQMCPETFKRSHQFLLKRNPQQRWIFTAAKREPACDTKHNYHWPRCNDQCTWNCCAGQDPSQVLNHAQGLLPRKEDWHLTEVLQTHLWLHVSGKPRYSTPTMMILLTGLSPGITGAGFMLQCGNRVEVAVMVSVFANSSP